MVFKKSPCLGRRRRQIDASLMLESPNLIQAAVLSESEALSLFGFDRDSLTAELRNRVIL